MTTGTTTTAGVHARNLGGLAGRMRRARGRMVLAGAVVGVGLVVAGSAMGATDTWTGAAGANWNTVGNWTAGGNNPPVAGDTVVFAGTVQTTNNNDFGVNTNFSGISFAGGASAFTLNGNAVLLTGDVVNGSAAAQTIALPLVLDLSTVNVSRPGGGAVNLGQVTFGAAAESTGVSTLNVNDGVSMTGLAVVTRTTDANTINIAAGKTLSVSGLVSVGTPSSSGNLQTVLNMTGGGDFNVTTATNANFIVGVGNNNSGGQAQATVDMTGLGNFTYSTGATGTGNFYVGRATRPASTLRLTPGTNTIIAAQVEVGDSTNTPGYTNSGNNAGGLSSLFLGSGTNIINTGSINVGVTKGQGQITFQDAVNGTLTLAGQAGGTSRVTNIDVGRFSSGSATGNSSSMLLAGHTVNALVDTLRVGVLQATGSGNANLVTFDKGTFDVNSLQLGVNISGASNTNGASGEFRLGGDAPNNTATGVLTVNTALLLGNDTSTTTTSPTKATLTINGGTANVHADIQVVSNGDTSIDTTTLTLAGGSLNMGAGKNIGSYASPVKVINLAGGTLTSTGLVAGNTINVSAPLSVVGTPKLAIVGANAVLNNTTGSSLALPSGVTLAGDATSVGTQSVSGDVTAGSGSRVAPGSSTAIGTLTFNNNLSFDNGSILRAKISDDGSVDLVNVAGTLTLGGTVNVEVGSVGLGGQIGQTYTIGSAGTLVGTSGNLSVAGDGSRKTFTPSVNGNLIQVAVGGSGPLSLTYTGVGSSAWTLSGPTDWTNGSPQQFFNLDQVTFDDSSTNVAAVTVTGTVTPGSVTVNAGRNYTFTGTGSIAGGTGITKQGSGTLVIGTNNTYLGTTDIQQGTVVVGTGGTSGTLGSGGAVNDNGTLAFNRSDGVTVANVIGGSGNVEQNGAGTTTLSGANTYTGTTTVNAGTLKATTGASVGDTNGAALTVKSGATFDIGGNTTANNFSLGAKVVHVAGNGVGGTAGAITNSGGATQNAAFNNITLDADALITGARIDIGRSAAVSPRTLDLAGHTLTTNMSGSQPMFSILDGMTVTAGDIVVQGGALGIERSSVVDAIGGTITFNTGTIVQFFQTTDGAVKRPMVFKGGNTIGSGNATVAIVNSPMQLDGDVTLQSLASGVPNAANNPLELRGAMSGAGGITKVGTNAVTLGGTLSYTGATAVNGGTLTVGGTAMGSSGLAVADGAVVQTTAGTVETLRFGGLNLNASGKLDINEDKLVIGGATAPATLVGYLNRGYAGGAWNGNGLMSTSVQGQPTMGIGWAVVDGTGITSWGAATGLAATDIVVRTTYVGDLNLDGVVGQDDFALLDKGLAKGLTGWVAGDVNYDGVVDVNDVFAIDTTYGQQGGPLSAEMLAGRAAQFGDGYVTSLLAAVPEPSVVGLVGLGMMGAMGRRRRG